LTLIQLPITNTSTFRTENKKLALVENLTKLLQIKIRLYLPFWMSQIKMEHNYTRVMLYFKDSTFVTLKCYILKKKKFFSYYPKVIHLIH